MTFFRQIPLVTCALLLAGCGAAQPPATEPEPLPVEVVAANPQGDAGAISAVGRIAHQREMTLAFRVAGTLARLDADIGDRVGRGQALAALDARDLVARVAQAEGDVRRSERAAARYAVLSESGAVARARYDDERTALDQARAALRAAAFDRDSAQLRAPAAGVVLERIAQAGETVSPGQAVLRIADTASPLLVRLPVPEGQLVRVRSGAAARLTAGDRIVTGTVSRIGAQVDARTGTAEVEIRLSDARGLVSGMTGTVEIDAPAAGGAGIAAIPAEAVLEAKGSQAALFLLDRQTQRARRRIVRFVGFTGDEALVAGLPAGAQVITSGAGFAADGQRVRVTGGVR
ncbi:efflux RND transporter periplasmic adaptor subunit [Sphingomonas sp. BT-65]|uniref:efflux RND transporter periplasmic adaptor subunit n=1 Tax=Sphingomonas sp. BT-65 TaxID=2989821 RepID=UPI002235BA3F|nr:efflux RND transporter periplasmic adaptor subunit [Sphingomonas sp. BT-65]MCW4461200.1 efflux RND transporter periplasmic adaptor subunit [Sphingomonas sp. BT-65]